MQEKQSSEQKQRDREQRERVDPGDHALGDEDDRRKIGKEEIACGCETERNRDRDIDNDEDREQAEEKNETSHGISIRNKRSA